MTAYAVALTFPANVARELNELRNELTQYVGYRIEPHMTLVYPFSPPVDMNTVEEKLDAVAKAARPFRLVLDGVEYFEGENNVAYVAVESADPVKSLHTAIMRSISGLIGEESANGQYNLERFVPHVTIGEQIPNELFPSVKVKFADRKVHHEIEMSSFALFFSGDDRVWKAKRLFWLSGAR